MMNDPMIRYHLVAAAQRERWQEARLARPARAATPDQAGLREQMETAPDLTGLVERVIQHVWKRLGLPAREAGFRPDDRRSGRSSGTMCPVHPADIPLQ
jgi:hypothetical protein